MSLNAPIQFESRPRRRAGVLREILESCVLLALTVIGFRTFAAEGYLISTGSMAPTLLGYHRRVECPACHFAFSRGAAFDQQESTANIASAGFHSIDDPFSVTQCPNCSLTEIDARTSPRNEGDQLLVHKLAYQFRDPQRHEVIVFQNQEDPTQAYVKRVAGLPGETILIQDGDLFVNGELVRKPYSVQRAVRILVSDFAHQPQDHDPDWRPRWTADKASNVWQTGNSIRFFNDSQRPHWMLYENWIRTGGDHVTRIPIHDWPASLQPPDDPHLTYKDGFLVAVGALTSLERDRWLAATDDALFQEKILQLYEQSHVAPIVDSYGYNAFLGQQQYPQHDLMLSTTISSLSGDGQLEFQLTDGHDVFRLIVRPADQKMAVFQNEQTSPLWSIPYEVDPDTLPLEIDFSLFDQQLIVALNGQPVQPPIPYSALRDRPPLRRPCRIGALDVQGELTSLRLYRDVYYTSKSESGQQSFELGPDEFFVLGDNSPVSLDSRMWESPAVPRTALIGKPFVVHLPSRQGQLNWKGQTRHFRLPDFSRVRYIQ